jgi:hypothetical protein
MNKKEVGDILDVVGLALAYGVPYISSLIDTWEDDREVTPLMIVELISTMKDPNTLFDEGN